MIKKNLKCGKSEISSNQISSTFRHLLLWTFGKHCVPSLRGTVHESTRARLSYAICTWCIRTNRYVSQTMLTPRRFVNSMKFIPSSSVVKAFFMSATSPLGHCCANGVSGLSTFSTSFYSFTRFPAQHPDHFGSLCTYSSKLLAATSRQRSSCSCSSTPRSICPEMSCRTAIAIRSLQGSSCALGRCQHWKRRRLW